MPKVGEIYKSKRRIQILKAVFDCLAEKGYANTTMRDILKKANLSAGAVYNYFRSKEEMVLELVAFSLTSDKNNLEDIVKGDNLLNVPQSILKFYLEQLEEARSLNGIKADISIWDAALTDPELMVLVKESFSKRDQLIKDTIREYGSKDDANSYQYLSSILISLINGASIQKLFMSQFDLASYTKNAIKLLE